MDDERDVAPPPTPTPRATTVLVPVLAAVVGIALATTAALVAPAVLRDTVATDASRSSSPTAGSDADVDDPATSRPDPSSPSVGDEEIAARLRALPGVADAEALGTSGEAGRLTLVTPLPSPEEAQRTADEARAILQSAPGGATWSLRVEGTTATGATIAVDDGVHERANLGVDPSTGRPRPDLLGTDAVADAVRLVGHDQVRTVFLAPDSASVGVRAATDLVAVAGLVRAEGRGLTALGLEGYGVGTYDGDGLTVPDDALLTLVADAAALPSVTQVAYEAVRDTVPNDPLLTVITSGDATPVVRWLDGVAWDEPALSYQVHGSTDRGDAPTLSGHVGGAAPGRAVAPPSGACSPGDLALGATGFDTAAGRRFLTVTARNDGAGACVLAGAPGVRFVADDGTETEVLLEPDADALSPITLDPGATAWAQLSWRGGSTADDPPRVTTLLVAPHPGDPESVVPLSGIDGVVDGLDLLDGGTATIGPWVAAG